MLFPLFKQSSIKPISYSPLFLFYVPDFHFIPGGHPGGFGPFGMLHPQWLDASTYMSYAWPEYFRRTPTDLCKLSSALCPSSIKGKFISTNKLFLINFEVLHGICRWKQAKSIFDNKGEQRQSIIMSIFFFNEMKNTYWQKKRRRMSLSLKMKGHNPLSIIDSIFLIKRKGLDITRMLCVTAILAMSHISRKCC